MLRLLIPRLRAQERLRDIEDSNLSIANHHALLLQSGMNRKDADKLISNIITARQQRR